MSAYKSYAEYLIHPRFRAVVAECRKRSEGRCERVFEPWEDMLGKGYRCKNDAVDPHHVVYCKWGEFDHPENILMLCRECHEDAHTCSGCGEVALKAREIKAGRDICFQCAIGD